MQKPEMEALEDISSKGERYFEEMAQATVKALGIDITSWKKVDEPMAYIARGLRGGQAYVVASHRGRPGTHLQKEVLFPLIRSIKDQGQMVFLTLSEVPREWRDDPYLEFITGTDILKLATKFPLAPGINVPAEEGDLGRGKVSGSDDGDVAIKVPGTTSCDVPPASDDAARKLAEEAFAPLSVGKKGETADAREAEDEDEEEDIKEQLEKAPVLQHDGMVRGYIGAKVAIATGGVGGPEKVPKLRRPRKRAAAEDEGPEAGGARFKDLTKEQLDKFFDPTIRNLMKKAVRAHEAGDLEGALKGYDEVIAKDPSGTFIWQNRARALMALERWPEAVESLDRVLIMEPDLVEVLYNKGVCFERMGDTEREMEAYEAALEKDREMVPAWNNLGVAFFQKGMLDEALGCFLSAVEKDPEYGQAWNNLGLVHARQCHQEKAIEAFSKALEFGADEVDVLRNMGGVLHEAGMWDDAISCNERLLELCPNDDEANFNLALAKRETGDMAGAMASVEKALATNPNFIEAWGLWEDLIDPGALDALLAHCNERLSISPDDFLTLYKKGRTLRVQGRGREALELLEKALETNPYMGPAWHDKGVILYTDGDMEGAVKAFEEAIKHADRPETWAMLGNALFILGRYKEAVGSYDTFFDGRGVKEEDFEVRRGRARALLRMGRTEEALEDLKLLDAMRPGDPELRFMWGVTLSRLGKHEEAIPHLDKAINARPDFDDAWYEKGNALSALGRHDEAVKCFRRAQDITPDREKAMAAEGSALLAMEKPREALECFDRALKVRRDFEEAWLKKGDALVALDRNGDALKAYDKALDSNPEDSEIWHRKGLLLYDMGETEEALKAFETTLSINEGDVRSWLNRGNILLETGRLDEAKTCFEMATQLDPDQPRAWIGKGSVFYRQGNVPEARYCFDRALEIDPKNAQAWRNKEVLLYESGDFKGLLEVAEREMELNPDDGMVHYFRGVALEALGRSEDAIAAFDKSLRSTQMGEMWRRRGDLLFKIGKYEDALESYKHEKDKDMTVYHNMGATLFKLRRFKESVAAFRTALKFGKSKDLFLNLARAYSKDGKNGKALHSLDKAMELDPEDPGVWNERGVLMMNEKRLETAVACFNKAIELGDKVVAYHNKGNALRELGRHDEASDCYQKCIENDNNYAPPWVSWGDMMSRVDNFREAIISYDFALKIDDDNWLAFNNRGVAYENIGMMEQATADYKRATELNPDDPVVWFNLGNAYMTRDRFESALASFDKALAQRTDFLRAIEKRAQVLKEMGRVDEALEMYEMALKLDKDDENLWMGKGDILMNMEGRKNDALQCYDRAVDINPDNAAAWYAKGLALEVRGATKKAEECFRMAGTLNPIYEEKHRMQKAAPSKRSGRITATSMLGDVGADELEDIDVDMGK